MGHWFGLLWPRGPAGYLLSLIPAVLLRSLVGAVAKGNRVACRRLDSRRKIFFFGWLSFGFFRKTASHFDVSVATGWCDVFNPNVWFERRRKCKEAAYVHLSWQDFIPPPFGRHRPPPPLLLLLLLRFDRQVVTNRKCVCYRHLWGGNGNWSMSLSKYNK